MIDKNKYKENRRMIIKKRKKVLNYMVYVKKTCLKFNVTMLMVSWLHYRPIKDNYSH